MGQTTENTIEKCETEKRNIEHKMLIRLTVAAIIVLLLVLGLSRAWFVNQNNVSMLMQVTEPSPISIRGPHGEAMTALDLSYTDADKNGNTVAIKRVVSVSSDAEKHKLEIVHTTNLKGLTFRIYPAKEGASVSGESVTENNYTYTYDASKPLEGKYINSKNETTDYKYANDSKHSENFNQYNKVQAHAEPIYWLVNNAQSGTNNPGNTEVTNKYLNYYVIEISWTETTKETDIFYLLAKNV